MTHFQSNFEFLSAQQKIVQKIAFFYFLTTISLVAIFLLRGFDGEELFLSLLIIFPTFVFYGKLAFDKKEIFPPHCLTPRDKWINCYFLIANGAFWWKGISPNTLPFKFMLPLEGLLCLAFNFYILIHYLGVGYVSPKKETED